MRLLLAAVMLAMSMAGAFAVTPDEVLSDPGLEARARELSGELRCLVCQNQSIDDSDADLAHELRAIVRERLVAGDSNAEVLQYVVDRYGEFVLLRPVLAWHTVVLWIAAPTLLLAGGIALALAARRRRGAATARELTDAEQAALDTLTDANPNK